MVVLTLVHQELLGGTNVIAAPEQFGRQGMAKGVATGMLVDPCGA